MSLKQTATRISTYAGDTSGVASALYELGGMTVMHDASGCNSTYSTHDEPRWYDMESLVFISGITEKDAIFGDDEKFINDVVTAALELQPRFVAIAGTPIPMMTGFDYDHAARTVEMRTSIPCMAFPTNGMHTYVKGASAALGTFCERFCKSDAEKTAGISVNILGATPLDLSVNGTVDSLKRVFSVAGIGVVSCVAMESDIDDVIRAGSASCNIVVSSVGIECAEILKKRFNTPYVVGCPMGGGLSNRIIDEVKAAVATSLDGVLFSKHHEDADTVVIGESVTALSLAEALLLTGVNAKVVSATEVPPILKDYCIYAPDEDDIVPHAAGARTVVADPMYRPILKDVDNFIELPHEAFSGRIYRDSIPDLVRGIDKILLKAKDMKK